MFVGTGFFVLSFLFVLLLSSLSLLVFAVGTDVVVAGCSSLLLSDLLSLLLQLVMSVSVVVQ